MKEERIETQGCPMGFGANNMINEGSPVFEKNDESLHKGVKDSERADDGYFGPGSITWKVMADPTSKLGGAASMIMQALNQPMMKLFYYASKSRDKDGQLFDEKRAENTGAYFQTIAFGDKAHVDKAAETVRRMHAHAKWTNPQTGELLEADKPEWLAWTHNTFVYCLINAMNVYGPGLEYYEIENFIEEQKIAAKLIGIDETDENLVPSSWSALQTYIDAQKGWMSVGVEASETMIDLMSPVFTLNPIEKVNQSLGRGLFALMPKWASEMYGIKKDSKLKRATFLTKQILKLGVDSEKTPKYIKNALKDVEEHPYRKVRKK